MIKKKKGTVLTFSVVLPDRPSDEFSNLEIHRHRPGSMPPYQHLGLK